MKQARLDRRLPLFLLLLVRLLHAVERGVRRRHALPRISGQILPIGVDVVDVNVWLLLLVFLAGGSDGGFAGIVAVGAVVAAMLRAMTVGLPPRGSTGALAARHHG